MKKVWKIVSAAFAALTAMFVVLAVIATVQLNDAKSSSRGRAYYVAEIERATQDIEETKEFIEEIKPYGSRYAYEIEDLEASIDGFYEWKNVCMNKIEELDQKHEMTVVSWSLTGVCAVGFIVTLIIAKKKQTVVG